jgi:hypothetical protein
MGNWFKSIFIQREFEKHYIFKSNQLIANSIRKGGNATHSLYKELIMEGYPLKKKKVALKKSWRSFIGKKSLVRNFLIKMRRLNGYIKGN